MGKEFINYEEAVALKDKGTCIAIVGHMIDEKTNTKICIDFLKQLDKLLNN